MYRFIFFQAQLIFDKSHRPRHQPHNGTEHVESIRENDAAPSASDAQNLPCVSFIFTCEQSFWLFLENK